MVRKKEEMTLHSILTLNKIEMKNKIKIKIKYSSAFTTLTGKTKRNWKNKP